MSIENISLSEQPKLELISTNLELDLGLYAITTPPSEKISEGIYNLNMKLVHPLTGLPLTIKACSGFVSEFAHNSPWLGSNVFTTHAMSWQKIQIPNDHNFAVRFSFTGSSVSVGFTGYVTASLI
jgi:hypothetical protein